MLCIVYLLNYVNKHQEKNKLLFGTMSIFMNIDIKVISISFMNHMLL